MKTKINFAKKGLSLLLSLVLTATAVPLWVSAAPTAAEYASLAAKLAAIGSFHLTADDRGTSKGVYDSTKRGGASDYSKFVDYFADSNNAAGSWVVSDSGQAVWDALKAYQAVAAGVYEDRADYQVLGMPDGGTSGYNPNNCGGSLISCNYGSPNPIASQYVTRQQANYTAPQIKDTIAAQPGFGAYSEILTAFSGNFNVSGGNGNYNLLSGPYAASASNHVASGSLNSGNWGFGWRKSPGGFAVLRSPMEAVQTLDNALDNVPDSVALNLNTALAIYYMHEVGYSGEWTRVISGTGAPTFVYRAFWHRLQGAPALQEGDSITFPAAILANTAKKTSLNTTALRAWRDNTPGPEVTAANINAWVTQFNYGQLVQMAYDYDTYARDALGSTSFPTAVGNGGVKALSDPANAAVLDYFGLQSFAWADTVYRPALDARMAALLSEAPQFFYHPATGHYDNDPVTRVFQANVTNNFDPRPSYGGFGSWQDMWAFYAEAKVNYDSLAELRDNYPSAWLTVTTAWPEIDLTALGQWMDNLLKVEYLWRAYDRLDAVKALLITSAGYHRGANDNLHPNEGSGPYDDSEYEYLTPLVRAWHDEFAGDAGFLQALRSSGFGYIVDNVFTAANPANGGADYEAEAVTRRSQLLDELNYRTDQGYSEDKWYSYRNFFTALLGENFAAMETPEIMRVINDSAPHPNAPNPPYLGVWPNVQVYQALSAAAKLPAGLGGLGEALWSEIYGNYEDEVVLPVLGSVYDVLSARLTSYVAGAMTIIGGLEQANQIDIDAAGRNIKVLSWATFAQIKKAIDRLGYEDPVQDIYRFLSDTGQLDRLDQATRDDYGFLVHAVLDVYNQFLEHPELWFKQTALAPSWRAERGDDILPLHRYTDVALTNQGPAYWTAPAGYAHNAGAPRAPGAQQADDAVLMDLIGKLDTLLGAGGDLKPLLRALNLPQDVIDAITSLGVDLDDPNTPFNMTNVVDSVMQNLLFNDKTLNGIIGALFPMLLNQLEDVFSTMLPEQIANLNYNDIPSFAGLRIIKLTVRPNHLYTILNGTANAPQAAAGAIHLNNIKVYPNQLGAMINSAEFPRVRQALLNANNGGSWASKAYPTNAWESPGLYRPKLDPETNQPILDENNQPVYEFWLDWGIDGDQTKFRDALTQVFSGLWPLLKALLAGGGQSLILQAQGVGTVDARINGGILGNININGRSADILGLSISGMDGYSKLMVPILECLLGPDTETGTIPSLSTVRGYPFSNAAAGAGDLADAIINPLMTYIAKLKAEPVTEILKLLPNLCYAFSLDRVMPLLSGLHIEMDLAVDADFGTVFGFHPSIADFVSGGIKIPGLPALNLTDLLLDPSLGIAGMFTMDGLMGLALGSVGGDITIPPFNPGRIATYGRITTQTTKRSPASPNVRQYIVANLPDVMQAFLGYLLGSGLIPIPPNGTPTEIAAALLELVDPTGYPPQAVQFANPGPQTYDPFPTWWADRTLSDNSPAGTDQQVKDRARADGDYLVANADTVLNVLWATLYPGTETNFSQGIIEIFENMGANGGLYTSIVETIQEILGMFGPGGAMENLGGILEHLAITKEGTAYKHFDALAAIKRLLPKTAANIDGYEIPDPEDVDTIAELIAEMVDFLEPIVPLLDILMTGGTELALVDVTEGDADPGNVTPLARALLGGDGFAGAVAPLLNMFLVPLLGPSAALDGTEWAAAATAADKLHALLDPIGAVYYHIVGNPGDPGRPVESILSLLPSLAYFLSETGGAASPLQQSLNCLLHPVYVLLDTVRPVYNIPLNMNLINGFTLSASTVRDQDSQVAVKGGVTIDAQTLLNGLLSDENGDPYQIGGVPISLKLDKFLYGALDSNNVFIGDKTYTLFSLLDQLGLLALIEDGGWTGVTKLIQYEKFGGPGPIDYSKAPQVAAERFGDVRGVPGWFRKSHAQFLADNADAVLNWAWARLIEGEPTVKAYLQGLLADNNIHVGLGPSLEDTVRNFYGNEFYIAGNFPKAVKFILGLRDLLDAVEVPRLAFGGFSLGNEPLPMTEVLAKLVYVYDEATDTATALDLRPEIPDSMNPGSFLPNPDNLMRELDAFMNAYARDPDGALASLSITDEASFKARLVTLLSPLMPLLRVFLSESNLLLIRDPAIAPANQEGVPGGPGISPASDRAFLRAYGYNGYETGLLPILMGIGADVPGFSAKCADYAAFKAGTEAQQLGYLLDPLLYLVERLSRDPVHTVLQALPNAAYFTSDVNGGSLLRQALANLLHPLTVLLDEAHLPAVNGQGLSAQVLLKDVLGLQAGNELNSLLAKLHMPGLTLENLVVGALTLFRDLDASYPAAENARLGLEAMGEGGEASYIRSSLCALLTQLLVVTGAFEKINGTGFEGLINLLNTDDHDDLAPGGPGPVDYTHAPQVLGAAAGPRWLDEPHADFLANNADAVLNWAWSNILNYTDANNDQPVKAYLQCLVPGGVPITLGDSLESTVNALFGDLVYSQDNFDLLVGYLASLKGYLADVDLGTLLKLGGPLPLTDLLEKIVVVGNAPLVFDDLFVALEEHLDNTNRITVDGTASGFQAKLGAVLLPFAPLLRVFLTEGDLLLIVDPAINNNGGFLKLDGYDGYRTGLLPILMGLGAQVPGFLDALVPYEDAKGGTDADLIDAILSPLVYLLGKAAANPVDTLLRVLPNALYIAGATPAGEHGPAPDGNPSILAQALNNICHPIAVMLGYLEGMVDVDLNVGRMADDRLGGLLAGLADNQGIDISQLVVGTKTAFGEPWLSLGTDENTGFVGASYVDVNKGMLLGQILAQVLALTNADISLSDDDLTALVNLLNLDNTNPNGPKAPVDYAKAPFVPPAAVQIPDWMTEAQLAFLLANIDSVLNWAWVNLVKDAPFQGSLEGALNLAPGSLSGAGTLEDAIHLALGGYVYTQDNFDRLVSLVLHLKDTLDGVDIRIGMPLTELLDTAIKVETSPGVYAGLGLSELFRGFADYDKTANPAYGEAAFKKELVTLLAPAAPLLRVLLVEGNLAAVVDTDVNNKNGLVKFFGSDGYRGGLLPILLGLCANIDDLADSDGDGVCDRSGLMSYAAFQAAGDEELLYGVINPLLYLASRVAASPVDTLLQLLPNAAYLLGGGNDSILQQALNNILFPLASAAGRVPMLAGLLADWGADPANLHIGDLLNAELTKALNGLAVESLAVGDPTVFSPPWNTAGVYGAAADSARYLAADKQAFLLQLLTETGALNYLEGNNLTGLVNLLNTGKARGPARVDYSKAPPAAEVQYPAWFTPTHAQFLMDNADGVVNWAWNRLFANNSALEDALNGWLSGGSGGSSGGGNSGSGGSGGEPGTQAPRPGRQSPAVQALNNIIYPILVLLRQKGGESQAADLFDLISLLQTLTAPKPGEPTEPGEPADPALPPARPDFFTGALKGTLTETIQGLLGATLYNKENFQAIVDMVLGLKETLDGVELLGMSLNELLKKTVYIGDDPLDLDAVFASFEDFANYGAITGEASFKAALNELLLPMAPLLRVLLFESDLMAVKDGGVNGGEGFLRVYGYDGYRTGVMPLLLGLGADVDGFTVKAYDEVVTDADVISAVIDPLLFLLNKLAQEPVTTLVKLLPNVIYFIGDANGTLLDDLLGSSLGFKLTDLIAGAVTLLPGTLKELGENDKGSFVEVHDRNFLAQLLKVLGAYGLMEENNLTGLVNLLNYDGRTKASLRPVRYPPFDTAANAGALYGCLFWTRRDALDMAKNANQYIDNAWTILYGKPLGAVPLEAGQQVADSYLRDVLGNALYTQDNFNAIVKALQDAIAGIDMGMKLVEGRTLGDLLDGVVKIGGEAVDVPGVLNRLKDFIPGTINNQQAFVSELVRFLEPAEPLLDFLLFGKDIDVLSGVFPVAGHGDGEGLLTAFGCEGYQYGLIPIYEALLVPLGTQGRIKAASEVASLRGGAKLQALLDPLLYAAEQLAVNPVDSLLKMLPNAAYFIAPDGTGSSPLQDSLDNTLYALHSVLGSASSSAGRLVTIDINMLLDGLLVPLGIAGLDSGMLGRFRVGTMTEYTSLSGYAAKFLSVATDQDRADLLTVLLTTLIDVVQDGANREKLVTMLTDMILPSGFGRTLLRWVIRLVLWWHRLFKTNYSLDHIHDAMKLISWFMPFIRWLQKLFGG